MSANERKETAADGSAANMEKPASRALVPLTAPVQRSRGPRRRCSPDPFFVTHLIATRDDAPQTRSLHRATPADAQTAYRTDRGAGRTAPIRTCHVI